MNPITSLRKLGVRLVGDDGLLTNAATMHIGLGPLERAKMMTQAREQGLKEAASKQGLEKGALDLEKGAQDLELGTHTIEGKRLGNDKAKFDLEQNQLEAPTKLRHNVAIAEGAELGNARTKQIISDSDQADLAEEQAAKMIAEVRGVSIEKAKEYLGFTAGLKSRGLSYIEKSVGGVDAGIFDDQLPGLISADRRERRAQDSAERQLNTQNAIQKRVDVANEFKREAAVALEAHRISQQQGYKEDGSVLSRVQAINAAWAPIAADVAAGRINNTNAAGQAIITDFNKILDPASVVRESEFMRSVEGHPILEQMRAFWQKNAVGGILTPNMLGDFVKLANQVAELAKVRRAKAAQSFRERLVDLPGVSPEYIERKTKAFFGESAKAVLSPIAQAALDAASKEDGEN